MTPSPGSVLITGSSSGIGAAIARALAKSGWSVVLNSANSEQAGIEIAAELGAAYLRADVSDLRQAKVLVEDSIAQLGSLDALINCAGMTKAIPHSDFDSATPQVWNEILQTNLIGSWNTSVSAIPELSRSGRGCIINMSSIAGSRVAGSSIPYACSKAALDHLTRLLAVAAAPKVRVNAVAPGLIRTPWTQDDPFFKPIFEAVATRAPLQRVGETDDVVEAVLGLLNTSYATGAIVPVDGGAHLV